MINEKAFFDACLQRFHPAERNCVTAVAAAIPADGNTARAFQFWETRPEKTRRKDAAGARTLRLACIAAAETQATPTDARSAGPAWGVVSLGCETHVIAIRIAGAWWFRAAPRGVARAPASLVVKAWEIE